MSGSWRSVEPLIGTGLSNTYLNEDGPVLGEDGLSRVWNVDLRVAVGK
jgi:hypothetical protein